MTIKELELLDRFVKTSTLQCSKQDFQRVIDIIEKEMKCSCLKSDNPACSVHGSKLDNCTCCRHIASNTIIDNNPNCPNHGISEQLNRSQME